MNFQFSSKKHLFLFENLSIMQLKSLGEYQLEVHML